MHSRTFALLGALVLVVILIIGLGAFGSLFGQQGPVTLTVRNADNVTHTFEVTVAELPANVTVHWSDGAVETVDLGRAGLTTNDPGEYHTIIMVELPDSAQSHGRSTLKPGEMNQRSLEDLPRNFVVVVVVYEEDEIVSWVSSTCDGNLSFLEVTMHDYGGSAGSHCQGTLF